MSRVINSNSNTAVPDFKWGIISKRLLEKMFTNVDEYEPIVGPTLPRSDNGDSTEFK